MHVQIETQNIELPKHSARYLASRIRKAMNKMSISVSSLHLSLRDVNGIKGGRDKVCTVRANLAEGGEVIVIDRAHSTQHAISSALQRSRETIRRELSKRRKKARRQRVARSSSVEFACMAAD